MQRTKRVVLITGLLIGLALIVFVIWYFFIRSSKTPTAPGTGGELPVGSTLPGTSSEGPGGTLDSTASSGKTTVGISDHPVFDFWINQETGEVFYLDPEGRVWGAKEGPDIELSQQTIAALNAITPSPRGTGILASFGDPHSPQWGIFDVVDSAWSPLPATFINVTWGANQDTLFGFVRDGDTGAANLARIDISAAQPTITLLAEKILPLDVRLSFLYPSSLILAERPAASYESRVWKFDTTRKTLNLLFSRSGFLIATTQTPAYLLWSAGASEFIVSDAETSSSAVPVPFVTFPEKCAATPEYLACFAPRTLSSLPPRIIPDDYLSGAFKTTDDLLLLDFSTLEIEALQDSTLSDVSFDGWHPRIREQDQALYFINRRDGKLYTTPLPAISEAPIPAE